MSGGTTIFLLLLQLNLCLNHDEKVILEKRVGPGADVTPICTNGTENFITVLTCKIKELSGGASCRLRYVHGNEFENHCGPKIELLARNHTVFLHLKDLSPEDSGMYSCECIRDGVLTLRLNVTVEDLEPAPAHEQDNRNYVQRVIVICSSTSAFLIIFGVIVGLIYKRRQQTRFALREGEEMDTYAALQEPSVDLYQTVGQRSSKHRGTD